MPSSSLSCWNICRTSSLVVRVEVAGRLVGEQQRRAVDQRPGDRDALLLAAGELRRVVVQPVAQADALEQLRGPVAALAVGEVGWRVRQRHHHVLQGAGARRAG